MMDVKLEAESSNSGSTNVTPMRIYSALTPQQTMRQHFIDKTKFKRWVIWVYTAVLQYSKIIAPSISTSVHWMWTRATISILSSGRIEQKRFPSYPPLPNPDCSSLQFVRLRLLNVFTAHSVTHCTSFHFKL